MLEFITRITKVGAISLVATTAPVFANDALFVDSAGQVGVGTNTPNKPLHVKRADGSAQLLVEETSGTTSRRSLLELSNNGGPSFTLRNTANGNASEFALLGGNDSFSINHLGTGGADFRLNRNGSLTIGPGGNTQFALTATGNVIIEGTLSQNSDINDKADIEAVDEDAVLRQLVGLPIATWRYKTDPDEAVHLGPMAQDFHSAFKLGADQTKLPIGDLAGVALVGVKALHRRSSESLERLARQEALIIEQQSRIAELEQQLADLQQQLSVVDELHARLQNLETRLPLRVADQRR